MSSTSQAAVCAIRRAPHEGQNPRPLHENATSRSNAPPCRAAPPPIPAHPDLGSIPEAGAPFAKSVPPPSQREIALGGEGGVHAVNRKTCEMDARNGQEELAA